MYFLAIFTKEVSFVVPFLIMLFDQTSLAPFLNFKLRKKWYLGFFPIFVLFVCLYFFVFPPPFSPKFFKWLGGSLVNHCTIMVYIWWDLLVNVLMPWTVKVIPSQYIPEAPNAVSLGGIAIFFIAFITGVYISGVCTKECAFFLWWYIIFYFPLSNLIPAIWDIGTRPPSGVCRVPGTPTRRLQRSSTCRSRSTSSFAGSCSMPLTTRVWASPARDGACLQMQTGLQTPSISSAASSGRLPTSRLTPGRWNSV